MRLTRPFFLSALTLGVLAGCTSVSFKQGAGGADYRRDERACMGTTTERTAFIQCMEAKGWWTRSTEELSQITLVSVEESEAAAEVQQATPADAPAPAAAPANPAPRTGTTTAPKDPLARLRIAMWSKMGAGANELIADQTQCLSTLGEAHAPDTTAGTVTRGLYECLRKQGWTGLTFR
ncbi:hypothetical protein [Methyloversatilis discipulorum]|uniref:hypothetical protein n=1 Tax=Methyloversatilis discipulorum TaxID=1119528 RepID=UPI001A40C312|nr:hypothetical protein [Methyloversatilis discipulorum]MBL8468101.1 hypothetical protein [Methyloversatilis discipulorum]